MMRCTTCGRFVGTDGPSWALKCACPAPCWRCGDVHAGGAKCDAGAGLETPEERCARVDALAARCAATGHTGLDGLVGLAKGKGPQVP